MKKSCFKIFGVLVLAFVLAFASVSAFAEESDENAELTGKTATEIVTQMGIGWNLGNTFDATGGNQSDIYSQEKSWGNPQVTKELIDAVKAAGFTTIRIPVTWYNQLSGDGAYTINPDFLARVKEVVDYAYDNDMYIILNVHHEEWVNDPKLDANYLNIGEELAAVWMQISDYFADYDQHLIFEGMNEPRMVGTAVEWTGNQEAYAAVNYLNQVFVNTVRRSDKGHNQERCLMIPGYAASSSSSVLSSISIPTVNGEAVNNVIISVHCYSPYNFCLSDNDKNFDPESSSSTGEIDTIFSTIETLFLDNGIPVVIGETSATNSGDNTEAREKWAYYMGSKSAAYGVPIVIWDNGYDGNSGGECHAWMDRQNNKANYATVIENLMSGFADTELGSGRGNSAATGSSILLSHLDASENGTIIWSNEDGLTSAGQWDATYISMGSDPSYYAEGREIAIVFSGNGEPKFILDSAEKEQWWIQVDPDHIETVEGNIKAAYFSYNTLVTAMNNNSVDNPSQLRNISVIATNDNITTYEIVAVGGESVVTYKANGGVYYMGAASDIPSDPSFTNLQFDGWYTTMDYKSGSEFTGGELTEDVTVYAKYILTYDLDALEAALEDIRVNGPAEPEPTDAPETTPTVEPEGEATPAPTGAQDTQKTEEDSNSEDDGFPWMIIAAVAAVVVVIVVVIIITTSKKKKQKSA